MEPNIDTLRDSPELANLIHSLIVKEMGRFVQENEVRAREFSILERMIRVEEALENQGKMFASLQREMDKRFEAVDKRFEAVDKRFEAVDKRFESLQREMTARFEAVDKRFEAVDKRFESLQREMTARFEALNKRLSLLQWLMVGGGSFISILITLVNFLR